MLIQRATRGMQILTNLPVPVTDRLGERRPSLEVLHFYGGVVGQQKVREFWGR